MIDKQFDPIWSSSRFISSAGLLIQVWTRQRGEADRSLNWWSVPLYRLRVHV